MVIGSPECSLSRTMRPAPSMPVDPVVPVTGVLEWVRRGVLVGAWIGEERGGEWRGGD